VRKPSVSIKNDYDYRQKATLSGDVIIIESFLARWKLDTFQITLEEWNETFKHPNPNWPQFQLIKSRSNFSEDDKFEPLTVRIFDTQIRAIKKLLKESA
jgi:hypothetical protein